MAVTTPERYLEFNVLDDNKVVTCSQVGVVFNMGLQAGRRVVWDFHQRYKDATVLYLSQVVPGQGDVPFKVEIKPTTCTGSVDPSSLYAVGSTRLVAPALPSDHYPKIGPPVVARSDVPMPSTPAPTTGVKRKRAAANPQQRVMNKQREDTEVFEVLSDSGDDVIVID
eukprot:TRINITY_DN29159_c0_g1_i1.p1 TRINITY_DN29159_c0_g1~~TRINITY_DN29159_c0_g1_i1.p1  ORF type:complete len:168 (+),score=47.10 TRINITY_DN29159_c0_g1_i1:91-594(+)